MCWKSNSWTSFYKNLTFKLVIFWIYKLNYNLLFMLEDANHRGQNQGLAGEEDESPG